MKTERRYPIGKIEGAFTKSQVLQIADDLTKLVTPRLFNVVVGELPSVIRHYANHEGLLWDKGQKVIECPKFQAQRLAYIFNGNIKLSTK